MNNSSSLKFPGLSPVSPGSNDAAPGEDGAFAVAAAAESVSAAVASLDVFRVRAEAETRLARVTAERDAAASEAAKLRQENAGQREQIAMERRIAAEFSKKLSQCQKELTESDRTRDALRAACDDLRRHASEPSAAAPISAEQATWESRAALQFEADLATYRARIQALLAERDALRKDND